MFRKSRGSEESGKNPAFLSVIANNLTCLKNPTPVGQSPTLANKLGLREPDAAKRYLGLSALSLPVRWGWIGSLRPWAGLLLSIAQWLLPFGSDRGAILVEVDGVDYAGQAVKARWRLNADANRGPYVPVLAAVALVRRRRDGDTMEAGARTASGLVTLADFAADFAELQIATATTTESVNHSEHYGSVAFSGRAAESA